MQGTSTEQGPAVFISYAHENDGLRAAVRALADWLGERSCNVLTDHPYEHRPPAKGWTGWMNDCIEQADVVLVVCTPRLKDRYAKNAPLETGRGATFEGAIVTQHMYDNAMRNTKFFPIVPDGGGYEDVPTTLRNWWNGHSFPSGCDGIRRMIINESSGAEARSTLAVAEASSKSGWSIETHHQKMTAELLGAEGVRIFRDAVGNELADEFSLDRIPREPVELVQWFAQMPRDDEAILQLFDVVHRALLSLEDNKGGNFQRKQAEEAAAALYCLAACLLVERSTHKSGDYVLRVPRSEPVIYAVIATALFGGALRLKASEQVDLPKPEYVFEISLPAGGQQVETDFERAVYVALFPNARDTCRGISLDTGPLDPVRSAELVARLRKLKRRLRVSFALVVEGVTDGKAVEQFASRHLAPIVVPDEAGSALLRIDAALLRAHIREFWSDLRALRPSGSE